MLALELEKDCVLINPEADKDGVWGIPNIKRGLKRQALARKVRIDSEMKAVLETLMRLSHCRYVVTDRGSDKRPAKPTNVCPHGFWRTRSTVYVLR